jgi:uncharacterized protein
MNRRRRTTSPYPARVFTDTSSLAALIYERDQNHPQAVSIFRSLNAHSVQFVLTNFIRAETHALLLTRASHYVADRFLASLTTTPSNVLFRVTEADEQKALELIERYKDKDFSITDATSFAVMERLGIDHALSFDDDFRQYGVTVITPEFFR